MGMSGTASTASHGIDPYSELDDVFLHFHARFEGIQDSPRSVAQAAISSEDLRSLTEWVADLHKKPRMWCDDPWQKNVPGIGNASNQEMFGALLVILAAEVCREKSSEEELWPAVAGVLEKDKHSFPLLFDANRQPGAMCLSAMTPTGVLKDGKLVMALGNPGGPTIINTVLQIILNVIDHRMNIQQAVNAPRLHHQWMPDVVRFEPFGLSSDVEKALKAKGHRFSDREAYMGDAEAVMIDQNTGIRLGASDPSVAGLVYIAAHMPDAGENEADDGKRFPSELSKSDAIKKTADGFTYLDPALFHEYFAADLSTEQAAFMARSQVLNAADNFKAVITTPAWRSKPSWMLVATKDRTINPDLERWYARRANSHKVEVSGASHSVYASRPKEVATLIEEAASNVDRKP